MKYEELYPCINCTEREICCHAHCEKYQLAQEYHMAKRKERMNENEVKDYTVRRIVKAMREKHERWTSKQ